MLSYSELTFYYAKQDINNNALLKVLGWEEISRFQFIVKLIFKKLKIFTYFFLQIVND